MTAPPVPAELVERMEKLVREVAVRWSLNTISKITAEARAIVALLPEPVDPDLLLAREIVAKEFERQTGCDWSEIGDRFRAGEHDDYLEVRSALSAIRRTREIERAGR